MAKTSKPGPKPDRHKSGFMVRLPNAYREAMAALRAKSRRTITMEIRVALDKHLQAEGIEPPDSAYPSVDRAAVNPARTR